MLSQLCWKQIWNIVQVKHREVFSKVHNVLNKVKNGEYEMEIQYEFGIINGLMFLHDQLKVLGFLQFKYRKKP